MEIELAFERKWKWLWIESNSTLVVKSFSSSKLVPWSIKIRWLNCLLNCLAISHSSGFMVSHIFREGNVCEDTPINISFYSRSFALLNFMHKNIEKDLFLDKLGIQRFRLYF